MKSIFLGWRTGALFIVLTCISGCGKTGGNAVTSGGSSSALPTISANCNGSSCM